MEPNRTAREAQQTLNPAPRSRGALIFLILATIVVGLSLLPADLVLAVELEKLAAATAEK